MKTILATLGIAVASALGDIDRAMWMTPEEIDSSGSREIVEQRGSAAQKRSLEIYREEITGCDQLPPDKAIPILWDAVFKLPKYNIYQLRERIEVFDLARDKLLSLPGHAEYFAELIERKRKEVEHLPFETGERCDYDGYRQLYLVDTLKHLPSPETVRVLGRFLDDRRDDVPAGYVMQDWEPTPASAFIAADTLVNRIGLRNTPFAKRVWFSFRDEENLAKTRAWFAPIKSGEKPFSFKGQSVEYRFQPDGTWTTTPIANPPDDASQPPPPKPPPAPAPPKPPPAAPAAESPAKAAPSWPWIAGTALALLAALGLFLKSRGKSGS